MIVGEIANANRIETFYDEDGELPIWVKSITSHNAAMATIEALAIVEAMLCQYVDVNNYEALRADAIKPPQFENPLVLDPDMIIFRIGYEHSGSRVLGVALLPNQEAGVKH